MSKFTKPLIVRVDSPNHFTLMEEFEYYREGNKNDIIKIPKGFDTDFASIPRFLWSYLPPFGTKRNPYFNASLLHDFVYDEICDYPISGRKEADKIFLEAMKAIGIKWYVRYTLYYAARLFGGRSYER